MMDELYENTGGSDPAWKVKLAVKDNEKAKEIWHKVDAVILDVDGTLIQELTLFEFAKFCGKEETISELVKASLAKDFIETFTSCIEILNPSLRTIREFNETKRWKFSPKVREFVKFLQERGVEIYLVSGSLKSLITPIAKQLSIPSDNIFSNTLKFTESGDFGGLNEGFLTKTYGKAEVAHNLKKKFGYKNLINIGDGLSDLEASIATDAFIGYGGNIERKVVKDQAMWYITNFEQLLAIDIVRKKVPKEDTESATSSTSSKRSSGSLKSKSSSKRSSSPSSTSKEEKGMKIIRKSGFSKLKRIKEIPDKENTKTARKKSAKQINVDEERDTVTDLKEQSFSDKKMNKSGSSTSSAKSIGSKRSKSSRNSVISKRSKSSVASSSKTRSRSRSVERKSEHKPKPEERFKRIDEETRKLREDLLKKEQALKEREKALDTREEQIKTRENLLEDELFFIRRKACLPKKSEEEVIKPEPPPIAAAPPPPILPAENVSDIAESKSHESGKQITPNKSFENDVIEKKSETKKGLKKPETEKELRKSEMALKKSETEERLKKSEMALKKSETEEGLKKSEMALKKSETEEGLKKSETEKELRKSNIKQIHSVLKQRVENKSSYEIKSLVPTPAGSLKSSASSVDEKPSLVEAEDRRKHVNSKRDDRMSSQEDTLKAAYEHRQSPYEKRIKRSHESHRSGKGSVDSDDFLNRPEGQRFRRAKGSLQSMFSSNRK